MCDHGASDHKLSQHLPTDIMEFSQRKLAKGEKKLDILLIILKMNEKGSGPTVDIVLIR